MLNRIKIAAFLIITLAINVGCDSIAKNDDLSETGQILNDKDELKETQKKLTAEKKVDMFTFSATYNPWEYIIAREAKGKISQEELEKRTEEINDLQYYTFKINYTEGNQELLKVGLSSKEEYYARVEYFSFVMQNDMKLIDGTDTLECVLFHFERTYGIGSEATFSLGFPLTEEDEKAKEEKRAIRHRNKTLVYDDKALGVGKINVTITERILDNIPAIETQ